MPATRETLLMQQETAQTIALRAAAWMGLESDMLGHFLNASGMSANELKTRLTSPEVLSAVMDFIFLEDSWVIGCADYCKVAPETLMVVRQNLPGGDIPHWT